VRITTGFFVILALLLSLPTCATAYGGGGADETVSALGTNKVCRCETLDEVRKGQRWHTRPDAIKKTAYEFVSSFPDADRNFLDSYDTGAFTKEEAVEILQWLKTNRLYMSDKALTLLNTLTGTSGTASTSDTNVTSTSQSTQTTRTTSKTLFKRAKQLYTQHPHRSRTAIAHNLYKELYTDKQQADHGLIRMLQTVDLIEHMLNSYERMKLLPYKAERYVPKKSTK